LIALLDDGGDDELRLLLGEVPPHQNGASVRDFSGRHFVFASHQTGFCAANTDIRSSAVLQPLNSLLSIRVAPVERDRSPKIDKRWCCLTSRFMQEAAGRVGSGVFRIQLDTPVQIEHGVIKVALAPIGDCAPPIWIRELRIESDRLVQIGNGKIVFFLVDVSGATVIVVTCLVPIEPNRLAQVGQREVVPPSSSLTIVGV
jgi:hypothetical protein